MQCVLKLMAVCPPLSSLIILSTYSFLLCAESGRLVGSMSASSGDFVAASALVALQQQQQSCAIKSNGQCSDSDEQFGYNKAESQ